MGHVIHNVIHFYIVQFNYAILRNIQCFITDFKFDLIARLRIRPRMLKGITNIDVSIHFLGKELSMPILIAPTVMQRMANDVGERGTVRG